MQVQVLLSRTKLVASKIFCLRRVFIFSSFAVLPLFTARFFANHKEKRSPKVGAFFQILFQTSVPEQQKMAIMSGKYPSCFLCA